MKIKLKKFGEVLTSRSAGKEAFFATLIILNLVIAVEDKEIFQL